MENLYVKLGGGAYGPTELNTKYSDKLIGTIKPIYDEMLKDGLSPIEAEYLINYIVSELRLNTLCGLDNRIRGLNGLKRPIGSKVKIKENLKPGELYGGVGFEDEMLQYIGKLATVTNYEQEEDCPPAYLLDVDDSFWGWSEEMIEDVK